MRVNWPYRSQAALASLRLERKPCPGSVVLAAKLGLGLCQCFRPLPKVPILPALALQTEEQGPLSGGTSSLPATVGEARVCVRCLKGAWGGKG